MHKIATWIEPFKCNRSCPQFVSMIIDFFFKLSGAINWNLYPIMCKQFIVKVVSFKLFLIGNILWIFMPVIEVYVLLYIIGKHKIFTCH